MCASIVFLCVKYEHIVLSWGLINMFQYRMDMEMLKGCLCFI